jgi:hypothetical protein
LCDTGDQPAGVLDRPRHVAVRSAERAEIETETVQPEHRVPAVVVRQVREAGDQALIVDAVTGVLAAVERGKVDDPEVGPLVTEAVAAIAGSRAHSQRRCDSQRQPCD